MSKEYRQKLETMTEVEIWREWERVRIPFVKASYRNYVIRQEQEKKGNKR